MYNYERIALDMLIDTPTLPLETLLHLLKDEDKTATIVFRDGDNNLMFDITDVHVEVLKTVLQDGEQYGHGSGLRTQTRIILHSTKPSYLEAHGVASEGII